MAGVGEFSGVESWMNINETDLIKELMKESSASFTDQIPLFDIDNFIDDLLPGGTNEASPPKLSHNKDAVYQPEIRLCDSAMSPHLAYQQPFSSVCESTPLDGDGAPFYQSIPIEHGQVNAFCPLADFSMGHSGVGDSLYNTPPRAPPSTVDSNTVKDALQPYDKPQVSYMEIIARALLDSPSGRLLLTDIYQYATDKYPYFRSTKCAWRNSIRHNLSVNECFVKASRSRNGRGFYWEIHPACINDFRQGDFNRRLVRKKVQWSDRRKALRHSPAARSDNGRFHKGQATEQTHPGDVLGGHSRLAWGDSSASKNCPTLADYTRGDQEALAINTHGHPQQSSHGISCDHHTSHAPMQGTNQPHNTSLQNNTTGMQCFKQQDALTMGHNMQPQYLYVSSQPAEAPLFYAPLSTTSSPGFHTQ